MWTPVVFISLDFHWLSLAKLGQEVNQASMCISSPVDLCPHLRLPTLPAHPMPSLSKSSLHLCSHLHLCLHLSLPVPMHLCSHLSLPVPPAPVFTPVPARPMHLCSHLSLPVTDILPVSVCHTPHTHVCIHPFLHVVVRLPVHSLLIAQSTHSALLMVHTSCISGMLPSSSHV